LHIGIDCGCTGAVAALDTKGRIVSLQDIPTVVVKTGKKSRTAYCDGPMATLIEAIVKSAGGDVQVTIENLHAMPRTGSVGGFSQGMGLGLWLGILAVLRVPVTRVEPARWKKDLLIPAGADKNASIVRALQLFPSCADLDRKRDHNRAEALLIAEWGRRFSQRT
jgi:crossover junction endodeoxyribonuclease RuvC